MFTEIQKRIFLIIWLYVLMKCLMAIKQRAQRKLTLIKLSNLNAQSLIIE
jgi:hypothetical protein